MTLNDFESALCTEKNWSSHRSSIAQPCVSWFFQPIVLHTVWPAIAIIMSSLRLSVRL